MIQPLISPDEFVGLGGVTHLCTGGEGPWFEQQERVYTEFAELKGAGEGGRERIFEIGEDCRSRVAGLWGVARDRVCFMSPGNDGLNAIARGLAWEPGDNVVTTQLEIPSVAYAWRDLRQQGVEVRMVAPRDWMVTEEDLLAAVDVRTRVLAVSQVSFYTGQCIDVRRLAAVRDDGVLLAVDATHASGVLNVPAHYADLCISSSYKWMLATHGVAPCYVGEALEAQLAPTGYGWRNLEVWPPQRALREPEVAVARMPYRMEAGNPAMLLILHLNESLRRIMEIGIEPVESHARDLAGLLVDGLRDRGLPVLEPPSRAASSGNTCLIVEEAKQLQRALEERRVLTWGDYGRLRISTHLYNGEEDVDRLFAALDQVEPELLE